MSEPFLPDTSAPEAAARRRALARAVLAALAAEAAVEPDRAAARATQQQADDDAHEAALAAVDEASQQLIARIRAMSDAELQALDAATLATILEAVTPAEDASLEAWRAATDADLAQAGAQLQALQTEIDGLLRATEARLDRTSADEEETEEDRMEAAVARQRTPLDQAQGLTDDRLTILRRYIYSFLRLNWVGYAAPGTITALDRPAQLATVALHDGSGLTVDGVEYGSGVPVVRAPTVLYLGVRAPADARDPTVRPVPAGRAWITVPPGGLTLYWYREGGGIYSLPWPPTDAEAEAVFWGNPKAFDIPGSREVIDFIGMDASRSIYFSGYRVRATYPHTGLRWHDGVIWAWELDPTTGKYPATPRAIDFPTITATYTQSNQVFPNPPFGSKISGGAFPQAVDPTSAVGRFFGYREYCTRFAPGTLAAQNPIAHATDMAQFLSYPTTPQPQANQSFLPNELVYSTDGGGSWQVAHGQTQSQFYYTFSGVEPWRETFNYQTPHYAAACWTSPDGFFFGMLGCYNTHQVPNTAQIQNERMGVRWLDGRLEVLPEVLPRRGTLYGGGPHEGGGGRAVAAWTQRPGFGFDGGPMDRFAFLDPLPTEVRDLGVSLTPRGAIVAYDVPLTNILAIDDAGVAHYTEDSGESWHVAPFQAYGLVPSSSQFTLARRGVILGPGG